MLGLTKVLIGGSATAVIVAGALTGCGTHQGAVTLSRVSCGSAVTHFLTDRTQLLSAHPGALPCFSSAARNCRSASISVTAMAVDTGTHYVFAIQPGTRPCLVTEQSQFYMVSGGVRRGPVITTHCRIAVVAARGVTLACRGQPLLIPAAVGMPSV